MASDNWNIPGDSTLAANLRSASRYVNTESPPTILTQSGQSGADAYALGPAVVESNASRVIPFYAAFEAIETLKRALDAGDVGTVYGCFGSFRVARGTTDDDLTFGALLPIVTLALDLLPERVTSVFAKRASLFAADDAWFVTLRLANETIVTLEAMASCDPSAGRELLIEVTGSDRVLRAEPLRQSVVVEPLGSAPTAQSWWEDPYERFLNLVTHRAAEPAANDITRVRATWNAMLESADSSERVEL